MGAPQTGEDFFALLRQSQLVDAAILDRVSRQLGQKLAGASARKLAASLCNSQYITEYHARQLLSGRYKGFYIAKYKALELLGSGGMGKVYLCEQITMQRLVALKVVRIRHPDRRAEVLARFTREARAVAALRHPNIIHAYDFDEENGTPYIVMEYVEGIDTAHIAAKFGAIQWPQAAEIIRQAALGLQHAHDAGLVHRDIKPGNLLVDTVGQVKLLDLGLCSALAADADDSLTVDQDQLGTVDFIAPEQAVDSHGVDSRADLYSLGATFYSLLANNVLYPGKSTAQKLLLHQTERPQPIQSLVPDVPTELAAVIDRLLEKRPADRFSTAAEVAVALEPFAVPKSPPYNPQVIKYPRKKVEPFMRRSPAPADISVATLGAGGDSELRPRTTDSGQIRAPSRISVSSPEPESESFGFGDDVSLMEIQSPAAMAPRLPAKQKRTSRSGKRQSTSTSPVLLASGLAAGMVVVALLATVVFRGTAVSNVEPAPSGDIKRVATAQVKTGSTHADWKSVSDELSGQRLVHHAFEQPFGLDRKLYNTSTRVPPKFDLTVEQARWTQGRFPEKGALAFDGAGSGQYAWFNQTDSDRLTLQKSTTIAVWFKVHRFDTVDQALLTKGDHAWRIHRHRSTRTLSFEFNQPIMNPQGKRIMRPSQAQSRVTLTGQTPVDDARWHLVTLVSTVASDGTSAEYQFYIDEKLEGKLVSQLPNLTPDRVWLGANSRVEASTKPRAAAATSEPAPTDNPADMQTWNGVIDEVSIWNRPLGFQKIRDIYRRGLPVE